MKFARVIWLENEKYFKNPKAYVRIIKRVVRELLGEDSKVFLFGSALKGDFTASSDIDVLVFSKKVPESGLERARILAEIRKRSNLWYPFEIHLVNERMFNLYKRMVNEMEEV